MDPAEWVTMREAADMLARTGVGRETTRRLLLAGLAGETIRRGNGTLHRRARVAELATRRTPERPEPAARCRGTFVARLQTWPVLAPEERWTAAQGPWRISALGRVRLSTWIDRDGFVPLVGTLGGFVVLGAEVVAVHGTPHPTRRQPPSVALVIRPAGGWYDGWRERRLRSPGRHQWWVWPDGLWSRPGRAAEWPGDGGETPRGRLASDP